MDTEINKQIFREYDIRGIYPSELNEDIAYLVGKAYGTKLQRIGKKKVVVAYDNRLSSPSLALNLVNGLLSVGTNVIAIGMVTSPMCYFAANYLKTDASVMITASHNPKEYNGIKFSYNGIHNAYGKEVKEIYEMIVNKDFIRGCGRIEVEDITKPYIDLVIKNLSFGVRPIKVVYDCGNGTTSVIADEVFSRLNIESIPLFNDSDGSFPNHHPDPCVYENLQLLKAKVLETHADIGIGYDGDGDRVGFLDELGNMVEADKFMAIMWKYLYDKVELKEAMYDVKCSKVLEDELAKLGVKALEFRTGASCTRCQSAEGNYPLSGELAGHIYFRDKWPGYDDGLYNGMRLIELLTHTNKSLSELASELVKYYSTPEIKIAVTDETKFQIVEKIKDYCVSKGYNHIVIDGVKAKFPDGFALVRASNTGPNLTLRFEAKTEARLKEIQDEFTNELKKYL